MTQKCTDARRVTGFVGIAFLSCLSTFGVRASAQSPTQQLLQSTLQSALTNYGLPAIAGAIITSTNITTFDTGIRKVGSPQTVEIQDLWNLGSCTKSMTATMIAALVQAGLLKWNSTIQQVLPDLTPKINPAYLSVTVQDLLRHRSGLPAFNDPTSVAALVANEGTGTLPQQRLQASTYALSQPPAVTYGTYLYSDADYMVAAAMAERVSGQPYESLMDELLFGELGIHETWGWPTNAGPGEPWGHQLVNGQVTPIDPSTYQVPQILDSAGNVSLSIGDWARFVQLHLRGLEGQNQLLFPASTIQQLHTPVAVAGTVYGYSDGWIEYPANSLESGVPAISYHNGTLGTFYATMLIEPSLNIAAIVVTNEDNPADQPDFDNALDSVAFQLLGY